MIDRDGEQRANLYAERTLAVVKEYMAFERVYLEDIAECAIFYLTELVAEVEYGHVIRDNLHSAIDYLYWSTFAAERSFGQEECGKQAAAASKRREDTGPEMQAAVNNAYSSLVKTGEEHDYYFLVNSMEDVRVQYLEFTPEEDLGGIFGDCMVMCRALEGWAIGPSDQAMVDASMLACVRRYSKIFNVIEKQVVAGVLEFKDGILTRVTDGGS